MGNGCGRECGDFRVVVGRRDLNDVCADDVQAGEAAQNLQCLPGCQPARDGCPGAGRERGIEHIDIERQVRLGAANPFEHFHDPYAEFARLDSLVRPGGILGLMTCFQTDDARFAAWHYRKDPTHVVFYREATMRFIARRFGWRCEIPVKDAALMWKPG